MLGGKPLVAHTIEFAQKVKTDDDVICVSTNDDTVIEVAKSYGLDVPFKRPEELASDTAGSYDVILHALNFFEAKGRFFDAVLLLQPTSPFRMVEDFEKLKEQFIDDCDMVVSVKKAKENPYFTIFEENAEGYLQKSKDGIFASRQECPPAYTYNGALYLIRVSSLKKTHIYALKHIKKMVMPDERSIDIDTMQDWILCEYYLSTPK